MEKERLKELLKKALLDINEGLFEDIPKDLPESEGICKCFMFDRYGMTEQEYDEIMGV